MNKHATQIAFGVAPRKAGGRRNAGAYRFRPGFTLLELMLVAALAFVLMSLTAPILFNLMRANHAGREHAAQRMVIGRLAEYWRADVAAATTCRWSEPVEEKRAIELLGPDKRRIQYMPSEQGLSRTVYNDDRLEHREMFRLGDEQHARLEIGDATPRKVSCLLETNVGEDTGKPLSISPPPITITSLLGRAHRRESAASGTSTQPAP